jgi:hypothetical protein
MQKIERESRDRIEARRQTVFRRLAKAARRDMAQLMFGEGHTPLTFHIHRLMLRY